MNWCIIIIIIIIAVGGWHCAGALLDASDTDFTYTAFHYQVEKHNNVTSSAFKLDKYEKQLSDIGDNFQLTRAGLCCPTGIYRHALPGFARWLVCRQNTAVQLAAFYYLRDGKTSISFRAK